MMRVVRAALFVPLASISLLLSGTGSAAAVAEKPAYADDMEAGMKAYWEQYDVPDATQDELFEKVLAGEPLDFELPGAEPVVVEVVREGRFEREIARYADGSIEVASVEAPAETTIGDISPQSVGNCQTTNAGTGFRTFRDCQAFASNNYVAIGFYMDYTLVQGGYDYIISVDGSSAYAYATAGGSATKPTARIQKQSENASGSAWANATTVWSAWNGGGSKSFEMRALVGYDRATTIWA